MLYQYKHVFILAFSHSVIHKPWDYIFNQCEKADAFTCFRVQCTLLKNTQLLWFIKMEWAIKVLHIAECQIDFSPNPELSTVQRRTEDLVNRLFLTCSTSSMKQPSAGQRYSSSSPSAAAVLQRSHHVLTRFCTHHHRCCPQNHLPHHLLVTHSSTEYNENSSLGFLKEQFTCFQQKLTH